MSEWISDQTNALRKSPCEMEMEARAAEEKRKNEKFRDLHFKLFGAHVPNDRVDLKLLARRWLDEHGSRYADPCAELDSFRKELDADQLNAWDAAWQEEFQKAKEKWDKVKKQLEEWEQNAYRKKEPKTNDELTGFF